MIRKHRQLIAEDALGCLKDCANNTGSSSPIALRSASVAFSASESTVGKECNSSGILAQSSTSWETDERALGKRVDGYIQQVWNVWGKSFHC